MNKSEVKNIIKKVMPMAMHIRDNLSVNDISVTLENASENQIIFYKIHPGNKARDQFISRYNTSSGCLLITNRDIDEVKNNYVVIDESRFFELQKMFLDYFYPIGHSKLKLVGVTGTNGKTSVVNMALQIAKLHNKKAVSVGTIGIMYSDNKDSKVKINATTPSYIDLRKIIFELNDDYDVCFFEFSSHALEQDRINDILLDAAAWTNFTQDHLDYHKTMENYYESKLKICTKYLKKKAKIVVPNEQRELAARIKKTIGENQVIQPMRIDEYVTNDEPKFFKADFNKSNLELALELNSILWNERLDFVDYDQIELPKGRFETIKLRSGCYAIVDYAHTPDALAHLLAATKKVFVDNKVCVVFGCGGDRDKTKRGLMGEIAERYADYVCVTSDNPRSESPRGIIDDILKGMHGKPGHVEVDRAKAVRMMLEKMKNDEVVVIAGKGHEQYQDIGGKKINYSDYEVIERFMND